MFIRGAGFAGCGASDIGAAPCAVLNDAFHHVRKQKGHLVIHNDPFFGNVLFQYLAVTINNFQDGYRFDTDALIGYNAKSASDIQGSNATGEATQAAP